MTFTMPPHYVICKLKYLVSLSVVLISLSVVLTHSKFILRNQWLVGLVVFDVEFGREDNDLISRNCDRNGLESLDVITDWEGVKTT